MQPKSKTEWLLQLRRYSTRETVEKMAVSIVERQDGNEYRYFQSSANHRLAEWAMYPLYDHIPPQVWHYIK